MWRVGRRVAQALLAGAAATWLGYIGAPEDLESWQEPLFVAALLYLGLEAFSRSASAAWRSYRVDRDERLREVADEVLGEALATIIEHGIPNMKSTDVGMSAFVVRFTVRMRYELIRVSRLRLGGPPPSPQVRWTKGKGIIGRCWEKPHEPTIMETETVWGDLHGCSRQTWNSLPGRTRLRLSYRDFKAMGDKYVGGMAVPIRGNNQAVLGVVAFDIAKKGETGWEPMLDQRVVDGLEAAAEELGKMVRLAASRG